MSELPYGMVDLNLKNGMHMFILGSNGSLTLEGNDLRIRMSPELVHRMIDFLRENEYDRTPLPEPVVQATYYGKDEPGAVQPYGEPDCSHEAWEADEMGKPTKCADCGELLHHPDACFLCGFYDPHTTVHECPVINAMDVFSGLYKMP